MNDSEPSSSRLPSEFVSPQRDRELSSVRQPQKWAPRRQNIDYLTRQREKLKQAQLLQQQTYQEERIPYRQDLMSSQHSLYENQDHHTNMSYLSNQNNNRGGLRIHQGAQGGAVPRLAQSSIGSQRSFSDSAYESSPSQLQDQSLSESQKPSSLPQQHQQLPAVTAGDQSTLPPIVDLRTQQQPATNTKKKEFREKWKAEQLAKDEAEFNAKNAHNIEILELQKNVLHQITRKKEWEKKRRHRVEVADRRGIPMPVGSGTCFCCVDNSKGFNAVVYYDILTAIFIVTIPRGFLAFKQHQLGSDQPTLYKKVRLANWFFLVLFSLLCLSIYSYKLLDSDVDIELDRSNESKVIEIVSISAATLVGLIIDFHFCQVVAFKQNQLRFLQDQQFDFAGDRYRVNDTEQKLQMSDNSYNSLYLKDRVSQNDLASDSASNLQAQLQFNNSIKQERERSNSTHSMQNRELTPNNRINLSSSVVKQKSYNGSDLSAQAKKSGSRKRSKSRNKSIEKHLSQSPRLNKKRNRGLSQSRSLSYEAAYGEPRTQMHRTTKMDVYEKHLGIGQESSEPN